VLNIIKILLALIIPLKDNALLQELIEWITLIRNLSYKYFIGLDFTFKTPKGFTIMKRKHINDGLEHFRVNLDASLGHD